MSNETGSAGGFNLLAPKLFKVAALHENIFEKTDDGWLVSSGGEMDFIKEAKGMKCVGQLLKKHLYSIEDFFVACGESFPLPTNLVDDELVNSNKPCSGGSNVDDIADPKYLKSVKDKIQTLVDQKEEASGLGQYDKVNDIEGEIDELAKHYKSLKGFGGRHRKFSNEQNKKIDSMRQNIVQAIKNIGQRMPKLGSHLAQSITVGQVVQYRPIPLVKWRVKI